MSSVGGRLSRSGTGQVEVCLDCLEQFSVCLLADSGCTDLSAGLRKRGAHGRSVKWGHAHECVCMCVWTWVHHVRSGFRRRSCLCGRRVRLPNILEGITDSIWDGRHLNLSLQFAGPDLGDVTKIL